MKNNKNIIFFISIILLGLCARLLFIDKPYGFWHNEMVMYNQAIASFPFGIIKAAVVSDVHFPLYQILLAIWMKIFSANDIVIRLFSVLMGTLTIVFAFFTGKELKDEALGNLFAFLVAINAVFIFYSQEVKFYIMLVLLSSISLLCLAKIKNNKGRLNYIFYVIANASIIYTFTIGIFYVFAQFIAFLGYIVLRNKNLLKKFLLSNFLLFLLILPFAFFIIFNFNKYESASWIFTDNIYTTLVLIQNYFTPFLIGIYNNPVIYIPVLKLKPLIFIYIPEFIAFYGIYKAVKINKNNLFILLIPIIFLLCEVILCCNSGLRMLTRYTILAILPLLLLMAIGLNSINKRVKRFIIIYLLIINGIVLIFSPQSAVRGYRDLGQKPVAYVLSLNKLNDKDTIIIGLRKTDFNKYLKFKGRKFSLLQDFVYQDYAFDKTQKDKYASFKKYIFEKESPDKDYEKYFKRTVLSPMKKEERLFMIWDENYNSFPMKNIKNYRKYPVMTLSLSKMNADTLKLCDKYLKFEKGYKLKYYKIFIFEKK